MATRLTYATMFDPPESLHQRFEQAFAGARQRAAQTLPLHIAGRAQAAQRTREHCSPANRQWLLGRHPQATAAEVDQAVRAAKQAFPAWRRTPPPERMRILRAAAERIEADLYDIAAMVALEVGKNRMEALGEVQETADFCRVYCEDFERGNFDHALPDDPVQGFRSHNRSVMKPYGAWGVIAPFNFPFALAGGPIAAALVTGNTVVLKGSPETPWSGHMVGEAFHAAGCPAGVVNVVNGGDAAGRALVDHPDLAGITFTGSHAVGMEIWRKFAAGDEPRPCIAEMGGKNAVIVTAHADLDRAALGIVRSAYGLSGQKCSALSRIYVEAPVADALIERLLAGIARIRVGDPGVREHWLGPVIDETAWQRFARCCATLRNAGARMLAGGSQLTTGELAYGWYCAPTLAEAPLDHPLWREEMFLPIAMLARVPDRDTAMRLANDVPLGLTAGFYGGADEVAWFQEHIEAGVTYANRPQGATTGAWPGYQPFGGWKGSGTSGKGIASAYYLALYQREQSQTVVE